MKPEIVHLANMSPALQLCVSVRLSEYLAQSKQLLPGKCGLHRRSGANLFAHGQMTEGTSHYQFKQVWLTMPNKLMLCLDKYCTWMRLKSPYIIMLLITCLFVLYLHGLFGMNCTDTTSFVSKRKNNIHSEITFICGSLYTCEIRTHRVSNSNMSCWQCKKIKPLNNCLQTLFDLGSYFNSRIHTIFCIFTMNELF